MMRRLLSGTMAIKTQSIKKAGRERDNVYYLASIKMVRLVP